MPTTACRVCGSGQTTLWKARNLDRELTPEDFKITDSRYGVTLTLHKCANCSFIFADASEIGQLTSLYEQLDDPSYEEGTENRMLQMRWLLGIGVKRHPGARTLLEIGAGGGLLIAEAGRLGLEATGVEPSKSLVAAAKRTHDVDLVQGIYPHPRLTGRQFDLVYLVDVIEHVGDPVQLLTDAARALAPGGIMLVVTPDVSSVAARLLGHRWWHFRLAHVGYFNDHSMRLAAEHAGLTVQYTCRIKWFFPVRYLAERTAVYLPLGFVNRTAERVAPLRWIYDRVIPLNLRDSLAFAMLRKGL
jgi:2-polyprenyl-3-methyl-5-hydroxy-6-metoxy-1,4-benzoquinol methylase